MTVVETEGEYPIRAFDSRENALRVEEQMKQTFPGVSCTVFCDPDEILNILGRPAPEGQVLIRLVPPLGKTIEVFRKWAESLAGSSNS